MGKEICLQVASWACGTSLEVKGTSYEKKINQGRITAYALAIIALLVFALAGVMYGVGILHPLVIGGMGFIFTIGAMMTTLVAIHMVVASAAFAALSLVRHLKKDPDYVAYQETTAHQQTA